VVLYASMEVANFVTVQSRVEVMKSPPQYGEGGSGGEFSPRMWY
jgi:hypothetical protein